MIQQYRWLPQKEQISYSQLRSDIQKSIEERTTPVPELLKEFGQWVDECTRIYPLNRSIVIRLWEDYLDRKNE